MKVNCDDCGKRPPLMFRRSGKYRGRKRNLIIKRDKKHTLCRQCHESRRESIYQIATAEIQGPTIKGANIHGESSNRKN